MDTTDIIIITICSVAGFITLARIAVVIYKRLKNGNRELNKLKRRAAFGNAEAQYRLGKYIYDKTATNGRYSDFQQAVEWLEKAGNKGHAQAQFMLGCCYEHGKGVLCDFEKAAEQDVAEGQFHLGQCYKEGLGVEPDCKKAFGLFRRAAKWNSDRFNDYVADARYEMAMCYIEGAGVEKNMEKAEKLLRQSAKDYSRNAREALEKYFG